ncbi:MAG: tetratricopeptide repeat protein [Anaerolineales bacterium]|nr:tetratricopeptide repeat protein [Anaerolineales bacterium]
MSGFFGSWFRRSDNKGKSKPDKGLGTSAGPMPFKLGDHQPGISYKKGDIIGQKYEVKGILGKGGFGVVYLVYSHETKKEYALKTFQDEFLADQEIRKRFHKEATIWIELGSYPHLVQANYVDEVSGKLYIAMEYVAPNEDGLNSLDGYLQQHPPDLTQSLRWSIHICHGMEYAYSKGVRAHRDLKPANIMISKDMTAKITDFGLAGVLNELPSVQRPGLAAGLNGTIRAIQTIYGQGFGTPTHMAPEQFDNAAGCDQRSDIYSFGVILFQMASRGKLPFLAPIGADFWKEIRRQHAQSPVPPLDSPLSPIIRRCLDKLPEKRYQSFLEARQDLEKLLKDHTGEVIIPPQSNESGVLEWCHRGVSLDSLGRYEEAIAYYDQVLNLVPNLTAIWANKGNSLNKLRRYEDAILSLDQALKLDPLSVQAWNNKGNSLHGLGRFEDAISCYDKALQFDPNHISTLINKGNSLNSLGRYNEAIRYLNDALHIDPGLRDALYNKGLSLFNLGSSEEAIICLEQALKIDPADFEAWFIKGNSLHTLGRYEEALRSFDKVLELAPLQVNAHYNKALSEDKIGRRQDAILSYKHYLELAPASDVKRIEYARKRLKELIG